MGVLWNFLLRYKLSLWRSADHYLILIGYLLPNIILQAVACLCRNQFVGQIITIAKDIGNIVIIKD